MHHCRIEFTARIAAALAALAGALFLSSCGRTPADGHSEPTHTDDPMVSSEPADYNAGDVTFANTMIPHHQQEIEVSLLAPDRSTNPEIVALAAAVVSTLQPDIAILRVLLVHRYGLAT